MMVKKVLLFLCLFFVFSASSETTKSEDLKKSKKEISVVSSETTDTIKVKEEISATASSETTKFEEKKSKEEVSATTSSETIDSVKIKEEVSEVTPSEEPQDVKKSKNQISESFSSEEKESVEGEGLLTSFFEDYSWFFEKKQTKYKIAIFPFYIFKSYSPILGLRLFTYSSKEKGHYMGVSFSNQIFTSLIQGDFTYFVRHNSGMENYFYTSYDSFSESFYGKDGMDTKESDLKKLYAYRIRLSHEMKYILHNKTFSSLGSELILRRERPNLQDEKIYFSSEVLVHLRARVGYDSRDSWKNAKNGHYHQLSLGCVPSLGKGSSFCLGELDLRYYYSFFDKYVLALRSFVGSSFISSISYSLKYSLGGRHVLRGFSENRFSGDKIYFAQSEIRIPLPIWSQFLSGVLFAELGEVAAYGEKFKNFKWDFGVGLRLGIPSDYKMKLRVDVGFALRDPEKPVNFIVDFFQAF